MLKVCFYHKADLDGHCSGAIVRKMFPTCVLVGVDYGDRIKDFDIKDFDTIVIVDFSFPREDMIQINKSHTVIWIDHHKSAIETMTDLDIRGKREIGKAGCELAWEHFFPNDVMPLAVKLLGRYDVWDQQDERVLPFQYGLRTFEDTRPDNVIWKDLLLGTLRGYDKLSVNGRIVEIGTLILDCERKQFEMYAKTAAFVAEVYGYNAIVINRLMCNSTIFDSVFDPKNHDFMVLFGKRKSGEWKYSFYAPKGSSVDMSKIAKIVSPSGGGHAGAAGAVIDVNLFDEGIFKYIGPA